jgi:outer membrane protein, heavy metal efflux system
VPRWRGDVRTLRPVAGHLLRCVRVLPFCAGCAVRLQPIASSLLKIITTLLIASTAICSAGPTLEVTEPGGALTLRQSLALALARNPELAAVSYDIRIGEARVLQAKLLPNPEAEFLSENVAGSGEYSNARRSENTLLLGQLIELGGKRRARVREASFGRDLAEFDYEEKKREVFLKTAQDFVDVLAIQRRVAINEQLVRLANDFIPVVVKRVEAGKASTLEKTRFDVAIGSARIDLEQAKHDLLAARQRLASRWGSLKPRFASAVGDLDATPATASLDLLARRLSANPRLARFGAEVAQREAAFAREKAAAVPDVTVRAGGRQINERNDTTAVVGFSVPLPLWNRNQGNINAAQERIDRADAEQAAAATVLMTELIEGYENLQRARGAILILRENVLPGADDALKATTEGYEAGRFSYLDVLEARRTTSAARIQYLQAIIDYHRAFHMVEALTADPRAHNLP